MKKATVTQLICALLVLLYVYTAVSKLADFAEFARQMRGQPLPLPVREVLVRTLPAGELLVAACLLLPRLRTAGLWLSAGLLVAFTVYVLLALAGAFPRVPCSCGGVLRSLGWRNHLYFNLVFLLLNGAALWLDAKERRSAVS
jgi:putative oxidoreductase